MAIREFWMGSFGPYVYDDTLLFPSGQVHGVGTDKTPVVDFDMIRLIDLTEAIEQLRIQSEAISFFFARIY